MIRLMGMNETKLTPRQSRVLNLINQSGGLSREEIQIEVGKFYPVSKPTFIRDLNVLLSRKIIVTKGRARGAKYFPFSQNPLLRPFDLDRYFQEETDKRLGARRRFDFDIFEYLHGLFTPQELTLLQKISRDFDERTKELPADILKRELERFVIELSWKSSQIEGNTYTLLETETLLKEQKEAKGRSHDEALMILNHKAAFEELLKNREDFRKVSVMTINQLHNLLVRGLGISVGLRKWAVGITGTVYVPLDNKFQIGEAFEKTVEAINRSKNPFEKALIAHVLIPYVQPYADGNKRTGRMLTNAILLAHNLYPLSYRSVDEDEFKKSLILFYEQVSVFHVKRLFLEQVKFANENYFR